MASFSPLRAANSLINLYDISGQRQAAGAAAASQRQKDLLNAQLTNARIGDISHGQGIADSAEKRAADAYAYGVTQREAAEAAVRLKQTKLQGEIRKQILDAELLKFNIGKNKSTEERTRQQDKVRDGALFRLTTPEGSADFSKLSRVQKQSWLKAHYIKASEYVPPPATTEAGAPISPFAVNAPRPTAQPLEQGGNITPASSAAVGDEIFTARAAWKAKHGGAIRAYDEWYRGAYGKTPTEKEIIAGVEQATGEQYPIPKSMGAQVASAIGTLGGEKTAQELANARTAKDTLVTTDPKTGELIGNIVPGSALDIEGSEKFRKSWMQVGETLSKIAEQRSMLQDLQAGTNMGTQGTIARIIDWTGFSGDVRDRTKIMETLRAQLGFQELRDMRNNSPTGGAVGNVSNQEIVWLSSSEAYLGIDLSIEKFRENAERIERRLMQRADRMHAAMVYDANNGAFGPTAQRELKAKIASGEVEKPPAWTTFVDKKRWFETENSQKNGPMAVGDVITLSGKKIRRVN